MTREVGFSTLISSFGVTARDNAGLGFGVIGTLTIGNALLDLFASPQASMLIGNLAVFAAQVLVTRLATQRFVAEPLTPHVAGFFLLGIVGSIGVLAGLVLAIVPGLYLAARWLVAGPILLVERDGVIAAMRRSWVVSAPLAWPLSGLLLVFWTPMAITSFGGGFLSGLLRGNETDTMVIAVLLATYFTMSVASVASWLAAAATYGLLCPKLDTLADTFA